MFPELVVEPSEDVRRLSLRPYEARVYLMR